MQRRWSMKTLPLAILLALLTIPGFSAQGRNEQTASTRKDAAAPELKETTSVTHHTIRIDGQPIAYTATAGTLVLRDDSEKPLASFFYVFYARDSVNDLAKRPI